MDAPPDDLASVARTRVHPIRWVAVVVGLCLVGLVALLATRQPFSKASDTSPVVGGAAPPVAGPTLDGSRFDLRSERGRWVVVNFFASWCAPCRTEHPELKRFYETHQISGDATVVSVVFSDRTDAVRALFAEQGGDWPVVVGDAETGSIAVSYGVVGVPESYLVAPNGQIVSRIVGGVTEEGLDDLIRRATANGED